MTTEREWVEGFISKLDSSLARRSTQKLKMSATDGTRLAYACEIQKYSETGEPETLISKYETDILIREVLPDQSWIPRVVIECKLTGITTHDALTYSAKASTHRSVHPYLRYGFLAGDRKDSGIPPRLVRHGQQFDFMITWKKMKASQSEWKSFVDLIVSEVKTSSQLQTLLTDNRSHDRKKYRHLHKSVEFRK